MWRTKAEYEFAKSGDAILFIVAFNPDLLREQESSLFMTTLQTYIKHNKPFSELRHQDAMNNLVIAAPVEGWADKQNIFGSIYYHNRYLYFFYRYW